MKRSPVGIGIIGSGFARTTQIPGFRDCMGAKVVAIASRNRDRAEAIAKEFGIEHVADDWQELVKHPDVDLVSIVTPPSTHMEITLAAIDQRKAVLCEKPMALNAGEAARMVEKAKAAGVLALIDHELRFLNSRRVMRGMLQSGAIGSVRHCNYVFRSDYRSISRPWDWWSDEAMGGGALGAIGSHVVDSFRWILSAEVTKVLGMLTTHIKERPDKASGGGMRAVTTDDEAKLLFRFSDGPHTEGATGAASISVVES
ncbi:MAG TPA: Gfo/Idh/MocA family oxidoreductase, partial [Pyrinomonadaceae bacterium]|nr:Gfo/Idh/MocA family oxidoreductase [Pyrinomonadaceae bacterium]